MGVGCGSETQLSGWKFKFSTSEKYPHPHPINALRGFGGPMATIIIFFWKSRLSNYISCDLYKKKFLIWINKKKKVDNVETSLPSWFTSIHMLQIALIYHFSVDQIFNSMLVWCRAWPSLAYMCLYGLETTFISFWCRTYNPLRLPCFEPTLRRCGRLYCFQMTSDVCSSSHCMGDRTGQRRGLLLKD